MKIIWSKVNEWKDDGFTDEHGWELTILHFSMATPKKSGGIRMTITIFGIGMNLTFIK